MLECKLEIALITYNRCAFLEKTLDQLSNSPFSSIKITIFDNHSSDNTPEVCHTYLDVFPNLSIVRRKKNIGGGPNYLRAIEASTSTYTWVVCDDDDYDFSGCEDVIDVINNESSDLIWVSNEHMGTWEHGLQTTTRELMRRKSRYYPALSFVPAIIFRTQLFDSECLTKGYGHIENSYPQFYFIHKSILNNFSIYVARKPIITRGTVCSTGLTPFSQYSDWIKCCKVISEKTIRERAVGDLTVQGGGFYKNLLANVAFESITPAFQRKRFWKNVVVINYVFSMRQRLLFFLILLPVLLTPKHVLHIIRRLRYAYGGYKQAGTTEIDTTKAAYKIRYAYNCYKTMHSVDFDTRDAFYD
ncbi:MAG: glycosyltransferase family 2 protein [Desulfuromonadaceae bacterium]|nr:glycosyltransferase family 2 protein [Desulfuromonadaceae bacterium]